MKRLVIGNMKMNLNIEQINEYINSLNSKKNDFIICPSSIYLPFFIKANYVTGIQNIYTLDKGSFTGEISSYQANSIGVKYTICGHSERRKYFNETNEMINLKIKSSISNSLIPILCVGEEKGADLKVVLYNQITQCLKGIKEEIIIAYEPIWAIGTNVIPTNEEIKNAIIYIKNLIKEIYNYNVKVLYGGSVNSSNIESLCEIDVVDGFLVGGSSINSSEFLKIIEVALK